ncbi:MAG TPA: hypothetical protein VH637_10850 [Streptosporangiaceae bacterium]
MSVLTRKRPEVVETIALRARLAPLARNARPLADAGRAAKERADSALAWAMPHVDSARLWAAPHVERTGIAMRDNLAPKVSDVLVATARRLEKEPARRRRWPRRVATMAMLAAAASAVAAVAMRRRSGPAGYRPVSPVPDSPVPDGPVPDSTGPGSGVPESADGSQPGRDPEAGGGLHG